MARFGQLTTRRHRSVLAHNLLELLQQLYWLFSIERLEGATTRLRSL